MPGCHGDYCGTLTAKELLERREDHQEAVMEAKRFKEYETLPRAEKDLISAPPGVEAVDASRPAAVNKVSWRAIVADREDARAVKGQWLVRLKGQWMSYGAADTVLIEQAVLRGAVTVKLDRQFEIQFGVGMGGQNGGESGGIEAPPEFPAMQVVSSHPHIRYPVMRDPPLKDQTVLPEPPKYRRQKVVTHDKHVWDFYKMVNCCHDCYRVYLYKDRQRMMSKTRPPVSAKMWREETAHLEDPRALEAASRSVGGLGHTSNASSRGARVAALMGTQIKTAGQMIKDNESGFARRMREADVHEVAKKFTMTLIDPATGRRTQGLGGKWSPPGIQAGSRLHHVAIT